MTSTEPPLGDAPRALRGTPIPAFPEPEPAAPAQPPPESPVEPIIDLPAAEPAESAAPSLARRVLPAVVFVGVLALVGYVVFSGVQRLLESNSVSARIAETQAEIDEFQLQAAQLQALIAWVGSDAYVERIAREDLGMVRPGEQAFSVHAPVRPGLEIRRSPWWTNLLPDEAEEAEAEAAGDPDP